MKQDRNMDPFELDFVHKLLRSTTKQEYSRGISAHYLDPIEVTLSGEPNVLDEVCQVGAAGVAYGIPMGGVRSEGVWVERDVWRVRLGLEANHVSAARENSNVVVMRVGVSF
jgi:hypothetical protein